MAPTVAQWDGGAGEGEEAEQEEYHKQSKVAKRHSFLDQPWYRPEYTTDQVKDFLAGAPIGAFLIRNPPYKVKNGSDKDLALSVQAGPKICHVLLKASDHEGKPAWGVSKQLFEDVSDLVMYSTEIPFHFPKLEGSGEIKLNLYSTKKAASMHKTLERRRFKQAKKKQIELIKAERKLAKQGKMSKGQVALMAEKARAKVVAEQKQAEEDERVAKEAAEAAEAERIRSEMEDEAATRERLAEEAKLAEEARQKALAQQAEEDRIKAAEEAEAKRKADILLAADEATKYKADLEAKTRAEKAAEDAATAAKIEALKLKNLKGRRSTFEETDFNDECRSVF